MAEPAVTSLLEQVKEMVKGYTDLIAGAENEFKQLQNELNLLKAFLKDSAKKTKQENLFRELEGQIRDVIYEVEDTIDMCLTKAIEVKANSSRRRKLLLSRKKYDLAKEVKSIREEKVLPLFNEAKVKFATMQVASGSGGDEDPPTKSTRHAQLIREERVVGLEDEEEIITSYLIQEQEGLDVIPIIGMPGVGKTTLAWKIFQKNEICNYFPTRIWVYISQNFSRRDVYLQILGNFSPSANTSSLSDDELVHALTACLSKNKFLLVLDDVWGVDAWNEIKQVLPDSNRMSKVLITSRESSLGMQSATYTKPHMLRFLTFEESWTLLQYEVFGNLEDCPTELRDIGKQIAFSCGGLPFTIVVIAGILLDQLMSGAATTGWRNVSTNLSAALINDSAQSIDNVIAFSFKRLPDELRDCFLYLGVFPEGYEIPAKTVYWLWIAEGFIQPKEGRSLEETAEENLNYLINSSLVKVNRRNLMGKVRTCSVHNMIRAFCLEMSLRENLFGEVKEFNGVLKPSAPQLDYLCRLCFYSNLAYFLSRKPNGRRVRSFLYFSMEIFQLPPEFISIIPDGFPKLRVLESKSITFHQFPAKVTKLIHLRYLTLSIDNLSILPEPIYQLWNLQTLVIGTTSRSITVKANMWRMIRLRHLKTNAALVLDTKWEGEAWQNLQTLERLSTESCTKAVSRSAKNLKTLGISGRLNDILGTNFLENLHHLENLKLVNSLTNEPGPENQLHSLSLPNCFPPQLKKLTLTKTFLKWEHMSTLAKIETLEVLKLKDKAFSGVYWKATEYCFPRLHVLLISNTDLVIWEASEKSFPCLTSLALRFCENLNEIPEAIMGTLETMDIMRVPESAVVSAKRVLELKKEAQKHGKGKPVAP